MNERRVVAHINLARGFRGGERQTVLLIQALASRGISQRLICRRNSKLPERLGQLDGLKIFPCSGRYAAATALQSATVSHAHDGRAIQVAALGQLRFGIPYIVTRRVMNPLGKNALTRWMYRRAAAVAVLSSAIAESLNSYDVRLSPIVVADACSTEVANQQVAQQLRAASGSRLRVGNVAALETDSKGQWTLLAAAKALPDIDFVLVGSGRDEQALRAAASGLKNLSFAGQVRDVASYLASFDVFAFPSLREGFGSTVLDAMHAGLPIVANRTGGIPDIISSPEFGRLVMPGNDQDFIQAVREIAASVELRDQLAKAGQRRVRDFSVDAMADGYQDIYDSVS